MAARLMHGAVYEVVKKKEAEKIAGRQQAAPADPNNFGAILKAQWEERKRELAAREAGSSSSS